VTAAPAGTLDRRHMSASTGSAYRLFLSFGEPVAAPGAAHGWVQITSRTLPDSGVAVVSNTGPVVPKYEIPGIFAPFRRLDGDRLATTPGAGLGLSIVQAVTRAHGGEVHAEPREGGGLIVTVTLPGAGSPQRC
jgi:signal transduction histidine kinase